MLMSVYLRSTFYKTITVDQSAVQKQNKYYNDKTIIKKCFYIKKHKKRNEKLSCMYSTKIRKDGYI